MENNIFFTPYIGKDYANGGLFGKRVMVLGESHYCGEGCCDCGNCRLYEKCTMFTQNVIRSILIRIRARSVNTGRALL